MAGFGESVIRHFPLRSSKDVLCFFETQLENNAEPNLSLLSVVAGCIENKLTCNRTINIGSDVLNITEPIFPTIDWPTVESLYVKFKTQVKGSVDLSVTKGNRFATRELVKKVSDVIWSSLTRSYYKDRAHLQSLYSYLTGNKLDCFGVAFAVVAAFQILGYKDVHLALSEDHAWVIYGEDQEDTAEVTWHGKGNEDKRGQSVSCGTREKSWLYLSGYPVKCTRHMEVAALVSGINPSINATSDSIELACLQQQLLWLLYDLNDLRKYPMALGNLGDLEEISPSPNRPPPIELFRESIFAAQTYYNNQHVYPYTYLGGYLYRNGHYKRALEAWANAADVIRKYNYGREDEEIYKEFLEIANELIPHVIKISSVGCEPSGEVDIPFLKDPQSFIQILRFIDGLCEWEEGSSTPVLHIGWAKPLVSTISKFPSSTRSQVVILIPAKKVKEEEEAIEVNNKSKTEKDNSCEADPTIKSEITNGSSVKKTKTKSNSLSLDVKIPETNNMPVKPAAGQETEFLRTLETQIDPEEKPHPNIMALAAACSDNILNPQYLLGSGEPFSSRSSSSSSFEENDKPLRTKSNGTPTTEPSFETESDTGCSNRLLQCNSPPKPPSSSVLLTSQKMRGLKELLLAEKLNTSALHLLLTAQSQVHFVRRGRQLSETDFVPCGRSTKRSRRD